MHAKGAAGNERREIAVVKSLPVLVGLEQMLAQFVPIPADEVLQFFKIRGPAYAIEKLGANELGFVEGVLDRKSVV